MFAIFTLQHVFHPAIKSTSIGPQYRLGNENNSTLRTGLSEMPDLLVTIRNDFNNKQAHFCRRRLLSSSWTSNELPGEETLGRRVDTLQAQRHEADEAKPELQGVELERISLLACKKRSKLITQPLRRFLSRRRSVTSYNVKMSTWNFLQSFHLSSGLDFYQPRVSSLGCTSSDSRVQKRLRAYICGIIYGIIQIFPSSSLWSIVFYSGFTSYGLRSTLLGPPRVHHFRSCLYCKRCNQLKTEEPKSCTAIPSQWRISPFQWRDSNRDGRNINNISVCMARLLQEQRSEEMSRRWSLCTLSELWNAMEWRSWQQLVHYKPFYLLQCRKHLFTQLMEDFYFLLEALCMLNFFLFFLLHPLYCI